MPHYSHMYHIAADDALATQTSSNIRHTRLQNIKDILRHHMSAQHRVGNANKSTGYYQYWKRFLNTANAKTSNSFWKNPKITFQQKCNVMQFRTGTLENQILACRNGRTTNTRCQLCHVFDRQIHKLSGCQHETMRNMVIERHNIASWIIMKAVSKGDYARNVIYTDIGSNAKLMKQNLIRPQQSANKTHPSWFLPHL